MGFGNDEQMSGCLWMNIVEDDAIFVLMEDLTLDFFSDDFAEEAVGGHVCLS